MGGINFSIHPLFFLFGLFYALTGKIFIFITYTISAIIHELGHSFVASSVGYKLNKITLMPFGAIISGNIDGLKASEQIKISLAGPFINLAIAILFVAIWWIYPESYAFTDIVAEANFSLALVNFLPIFPLDGGRVLSSILDEWLGRKKAFIISKIIGVIFSLMLLALFVVSIFHQINISLLFFSLFVLFGALNRNKENKYIRINSVLSNQRLKRGLVYKKQALHKSASVKKLISMLDEYAVNEIVVFDDGKPIKTLSQENINAIIEKGQIHSPIGDFI